MKIGEEIENYGFKVGEDETVIAEKAFIKEATLRSTKLLINYEKARPFDTTWEVHFTLCIIEKNRLYERIVIESYVDVELHPREIVNPEILLWLSEEELTNLRTRMIWETNYPLVNIFDPFDFEEDDKSNQKKWDTKDLLRLLNMNESELTILRDNWLRKQTYKKFGL